MVRTAHYQAISSLQIIIMIIKFIFINIKFNIKPRSISNPTVRQCAHAYVLVCVRACVRECVRECVRACCSCVYVCAHARAHVCVGVRASACLCAHARVYI